MPLLHLCIGHPSSFYKVVNGLIYIKMSYLDEEQISILYATLMLEQPKHQKNPMSTATLVLFRSVLSVEIGLREALKAQDLISYISSRVVSDAPSL